jgi:D-amino-acid dehydrogenase
MLPNMMPRVGRGRLPGIFYNTGHGHLGWTLSAATAEMVAESVAQSMPAAVPAAAPVRAIPVRAAA